MKSLLRFMLLVVLAQPAFAESPAQTASDSMNLTGVWEVSPANPSSISTFVIGKLELIQTGKEIKGSYVITKKDKSAICSSSSFDVTGTVDGNKVVLSAVGEKSKLNGSASGDSNTLTGMGMEFFEGTICSGYVQSKFVMSKL